MNVQERARNFFGRFNLLDISHSARLRGIAEMCGGGFFAWLGQDMAMTGSTSTDIGTYAVKALGAIIGIGGAGTTLVGTVEAITDARLRYKLEK